MASKIESRAWGALNKAIVRVRRAVNKRGLSFEVNFEMQELRRKRPIRRTHSGETKP